MKKLTLICFIALAAIMPSNGQVFYKGDVDLNAGLGIGFNLYPIVNREVGIPPVSLSVDYGLKDDLGPGVLGIGGIIGYSSFKSRYYFGNNTVYGYKYTALFIGARGTYHLELLENLDCYGGAMLHYTSLDQKYYGLEVTTTNPLASRIGVSLFVGTKYFFTGNIAAFAEFGYSISWLTVGMSIKL